MHYYYFQIERNETAFGQFYCFIIVIRMCNGNRIYLTNYDWQLLIQFFFSFGEHNWFNGPSNTENEPRHCSGAVWSRGSAACVLHMFALCRRSHRNMNDVSTNFSPAICNEETKWKFRSILNLIRHQINFHLASCVCGSEQCASRLANASIIIR